MNTTIQSTCFPWPLIVSCWVISFCPAICVATDGDLDFNRDIRPILSDTCFKCHGPDAAERQADLRLDTKEGIVDAEYLLSPGDSEHSELYARLVTDDSDELMPPAESGRKLSEEQKQLLKRWIDSGAKWENHWSFETPVKLSPPVADDDKWSTNEIDRFVLRKLNDLKLKPNLESDRNTLIRRVCLDLTGLPPTLELLDRFELDNRNDWYELLVDELLASQQYGEHMARFWLDAARYADTHGLHLDNYREMWLYRDWVISAFNENLSFRDFLIQQLAGDLLDSPTEPQLIATGFNRAHVTTNEGGSIVEEVMVRNVVDRVSTTGTVFMGLTFGCAQCHDHKYDPISQKDFFSLFAFFNSLDGNAMDGNAKAHAPVHRHFAPDDKVKIKTWRDEIATLKKDIDTKISTFAASYVDPVPAPTPENDTDVSNEAIDSVATVAEPDSKEAAQIPSDYIWLDDELPKNVKKTGAWKKDSKSIEVFSGNDVYVDENQAFSQLVITEANPRLRFTQQDNLFVHVYLDPDKPPKQIMVQFNDGSWEHRAYWGENHITFGKDQTPSRLRLGDLPEAGKWHRLEIKAEKVGFKETTSIHGIAFSQHGGKVFWDAAGVATTVPQSYAGKSFTDWLVFQEAIDAMDLPKNLRNQFKEDATTDKFKAAAQDYFYRNVHPDSKAIIESQVNSQMELEKQVDELTKKAPTTLIWKEKNKPVQAHILNRGEYDQKGEEVDRNLPGFLPAFSDKYPKDRLGLAQWLVSDEHPLTSRVTVNRFWQQFFGTGIVATSEDFGSQGELPTHPELLDWLAIEFRESGWDVKDLVKKIVMSSTYRQSSQATSEKIAADDGNRYFSRGPRYRLDAESLRDQALSIAEILIPTIGGPGVKPPQPDGLWYAVGYSRSNTVRFKKDSGNEKVHRRSVYTFWKRTAPPPQMSTLDAPSRESCIVRRERTNTPLQALLLMNDPQYVEAARYFAQTAMDAKLQSNEAVIRFMFRRAMSTSPTASQMKILLNDLKTNLAVFDKDQESAKQLIAIGETPADETYDAGQLAAYTMLANLIMNQDEFITKN